MLKSLCTPAFIYFLIGAFSLTISFLSILFRKDFSFNTFFVFTINVITILFWTWLLNLICKNGYTNVSWFLLILPYVFLFALLIWMIFTLKRTKKDISSVINMTKKIPTSSRPSRKSKSSKK
jgi:hypothetical protein